MPRFWQTVPSALLVLLTLAHCSAAPPEPPQAKPRIQLMTSLPMIWGEGASMESILAGDSRPAPIYRYWLDQYDMTAVDSLENLAGQDPDIVILAQPRAMDPADLTELDAWVRAGGSVIIMTDPELVWPTALPLADPRRPLTSGLLSPLLGHWGLELVAVAEPGTDVVNLRLGPYAFASRGVGRLEPVTADAIPAVRCDLGEAGIFAQCSVGQGRAVIVADADFLNAALWPEEARQSPQKSAAVRFVDHLVRDQMDSMSATDENIAGVSRH